MDEVILQMLEKYNCKNRQDYDNALKEIIQEISLLGLWRAKFFEHAVFYGGSTLRILHGLNRFSEDLDFSLIKPKVNFSLSPYLNAIKEELESYGFEVEKSYKEKKAISQIESAFIKAGTTTHFLKANVPKAILRQIQSNENLKVKIEVDTTPPSNFEVEVKNLLQPILFQVKTMKIEDLFAGKLHAVLAREWKQRVKGRDFYDLIWYIARGESCNLKHLKARLVQSGNYEEKKDLHKKDLLQLLQEKIKHTDIEMAKKDIQAFLKPQEIDSLGLWTKDFFLDLVAKIKVES